MTYKELAEYLLSLPAEILESQAYFSFDIEGVLYDLQRENLRIEEDYINSKTHVGHNVSTGENVLIVSEKGTKIYILTID